MTDAELIKVLTGNTAIMRATLESVRDDLWDLMGSSSESLRSNIACEISRKIRAALDTPKRNCDVGSPEEQTLRKREYCKKTQCSGCPANKSGTISSDYCDFVWAQMPYAVEGGGTECGSR